VGFQRCVEACELDYIVTNQCFVKCCGINGIVTKLRTGLENPPKVLASSYRIPDGSYTSTHYPHMGKANTPYSKTVIPTEGLSEAKLPKADVIFDKLLSRDLHGFVPQPSGINSIFTSLATVVTHDIFWSDPERPSINLASSYLDMAWLYGSSEEAVKRIRDPSGGPGKINETLFSDHRLQLQPACALAIIAVFAKEHNRLCAELLKRYPERFGDKKDQDELLFQTAKAINNNIYISIILDDYLRAIRGTETIPLNTRKGGPWDPTSGNQVSIEFNFIYRWHSLISKADEKDIHDRFVESKGDRKQMRRALISQDGKTWADGQLEKAFEAAYTEPAGAFKCMNIPAIMKPFEIHGIEQARKLNLCSFNELRAHFNLPLMKSWSDFTDVKEVQDVLASLYSKPDDVEMYVGLLAEQGNNRGLDQPYTLSRLIITDALHLILNDRFLTLEANPSTLTRYGYDCAMNSDLTQLIERNTTLKFGDGAGHVLHLPKSTKTK
jgi:hypothetical protein